MPSTSNSSPTWRPASSTRSRASAVLWIAILWRRLSRGYQQPRKLDLRLLRLALDELDEEFPAVAIVEEKSHFRPDRWEGFDHASSLDASCFTLALPHVDEQFIPDGRVVDISFQPAVEPERVIEVEVEALDDRLRERIQAARLRDLEGSIDLRRERRSKDQGFGSSHAELAFQGSPHAQPWSVMTFRRIVIPL